MSTPKFPKIKTASAIDQAMLDRLVADPRKAYENAAQINPSQVAGVLRRNIREISDVENIFKAMPWLHLSREILISSIVSPGDLIKVVLSIYNQLKQLPPSLGGQLDQVLKEHFLKEQGLESKVYSWVDEAMIMKGARPIMIIPEASLDKMINGSSNVSMEAVASYDNQFKDDWFTPKGLFAIPVKTPDKTAYTSFENASRLTNVSMKDLHTIRGHRLDHKGTKREIKLPIQVTDNMAVLRKPQVDHAKRSLSLKNIYGESSFEAVSKQKFSNAAIHKEFFKRPKPSSRSRLEIIQVTKPEQNQNLGHPLVFHLPAESVVPIFVPGDVTNHPWYIVILEANGYPVSWTRQLNFYDDVRSHLSNNGSEGQAAGDILQLAKETTAGSIPNVSVQDIDRATEVSASIIEQDLVSRINNGLMGGDFEISMPDAIKRMLFARTCMGKQTTMVLVPADYMIYMAYEFNEFGVGKSILEDGKALAAQAASVHVATVLGAIQNAIPGKDINIELSPDDMHPLETAVYMANEALGLAYRQMPSTIGSTAGLTEQLQLSGFNINISGNPRFPSVKSTITPRESSQVLIDPALNQSLKDDMNKIFGLTPELVDNMNQPEFATTAVNNSILLLKRVMVGQSKTNPFLTDYIRTFTYNSGILITRLLEVLEKNAKSIPKGYDNPMDVLEDYLNNVFCELPQPQTDDLIKQAELLEKIGTAVDTVLDANFKQEFLGGFDNPALEEAYPIIRECYKGLMLRQWMRKHGVFRDLDVFMSDDEGSPLADLKAEMLSHTAVLRSSIGDWYKSQAEFVERHKKRTENLISLGEKAKESSTPDPDASLSEDELGTTTNPTDEPIPTDGDETDNPDVENPELDDTPPPSTDGEEEEEEEDPTKDNPIVPT